VCIERHFTKQEVAKCIGAESRYGLVQVQLHTSALAEPFTGEKNEAVRPDPPGKCEACRLQHGRPHDCVQPGNILAHYVHGRPPALELPVGVADSRHVVGQRIEPDPRALNVSVTRGYRERNGPLQVGARDGDVFKSTVNQCEEFVASGLRLYELRIVSQQVPEELFVAGQAEEPVALFGPLKFASGVQNAVSVLDFVLAFEQLTPYTIPAFVGALMKVIRAALEHVPHERLHSLAMRGVRGANELVVRYAQLRPRGGEPCREVVNELLRSDTMLAGGLRNLLSVFVHSHEEVNVIPGMAVVACDCICANLFVGVPEVGIAVGVIDGGGDEEGLHPFTGRWGC